jgi:hypothetical protein
LPSPLARRPGLEPGPIVVDAQRWRFRSEYCSTWVPVQGRDTVKSTAAIDSPLNPQFRKNADLLKPISVILPDGQISEFLSSPRCKNILLFRNTNQLYNPRRLVPQEGRLAIVTDAGRDAVDVDVSLTNGAEADGEGVWS